MRSERSGASTPSRIESNVVQVTIDVGPKIVFLLIAEYICPCRSRSRVVHTT